MSGLRRQSSELSGRKEEVKSAKTSGTSITISATVSSEREVGAVNLFISFCLFRGDFICFVGASENGRCGRDWLKMKLTILL